MCLPACHVHLVQFVSRRGLLTGSLGVVGVSAGGAAPPETPVSITAAKHIVDLTHVLDPDFPTYSGQPQIELRRFSSLETDGWNIHEWRLNEHTGTHIDAPIHRSTGSALDAISAEQLIGPLAVIDLRIRASAAADTELTPDDLRAWERRHGPLPDGAVVALCSGWGAHARTPRFRGADDSGRLHFPGVHAEAAAFLLESRHIKGLVVDTLSLDPGNSTEFPVHTRWLGAGKWGLECVANLETLPASGATIIVGAPKVAGATGGPSRVFALW
jgi:kynurenine formamidase